MLRQRDVYSRIYVSPREIEQCFAKRKNSPGDDVEYELAHILVSVPPSATPEQVEARVARAQGVYERARARRGLRPAGHLLFRRRHRARGRRPRLAQGQASCRRSRRTRSRKLQAGRGHRADPHAERPAPLQADRHARRDGRRGGVAGPCAPHPARDQRGRGRRRRASRSSRNSATASSRARASRPSPRSTPPTPARRRSGGDLGWVGPGTFVPVFEQHARRAAGKRDQPAVQDAVRLAHRAAARPPHLRRDRRRDPQSLRGAAARVEGGGRDRDLAAPPARRGVRRISACEPGRRHADHRRHHR